MKPYYEHGGITIYHGDCREVLPLPNLDETFDSVITDPPYNETSLEWDVWPDGWPAFLIGVTDSLWCFGSMRMFLERRDDFDSWKFAQDVVWEKQNGSGFASDRFKRVHEMAAQFYRGEWDALTKDVPKRPYSGPSKSIRGRGQTPHTGKIGKGSYEDDGTRLERSVLFVRNCQGHAENETQKPEGIVAPLLQYSVPAGGSVLDCFMGSGTTLVVAKAQGKRAVGIDVREEQCEAAARRLSQEVFAL